MKTAQQIFLLAFAIATLLNAKRIYAQKADSVKPVQSFNSEDYIVMPVNASVLPGFSIGAAVKGVSGKKIINGLSFNLFGGFADRLAGAEFSVIWGGYTEDAFGVQAAAIGNSVGGSLTGVQMAGIGSIVSNDLKGMQASGIANIAGGRTWGVQAAGIGNLSSHGLEGAQAAGIANIAAGGDSWGVQAAGIANIATHNFDGVQTAGITNIVGGEMTGIQASLVNVAGTMNGVQFGLINVAGDGDGIPIGLVSFVKERGFNVDLWGDEMGFAHVTLRSGTRNFANYLGIAWQPLGLVHYVGILYGVGAEFSLGDAAYTTLDLMSMAVSNPQYSWNILGLNNSVRDVESWSRITKLRATIGLKILPGIHIFGGATLNAFTSSNNLGENLVLWSFFDAQIGQTTLRLSPGLVAGIRLF